MVPLPINILLFGFGSDDITATCTDLLETFGATAKIVSYNLCSSTVAETFDALRVFGELFSLIHFSNAFFGRYVFQHFFRDEGVFAFLVPLGHVTAVSCMANDKDEDFEDWFTDVGDDGLMRRRDGVDGVQACRRTENALPTFVDGKDLVAEYVALKALSRKERKAVKKAKKSKHSLVHRVPQAKAAGHRDERVQAVSSSGGSVIIVVVVVVLVIVVIVVIVVIAVIVEHIIEGARRGGYGAPHHADVHVRHQRCLGHLCRHDKDVRCVKGRRKCCGVGAEEA
jgi:hypothetical protein